MAVDINSGILYLDAQDMLKIQEELGRKFEADDVAADDLLMDSAEAYAQAYQGDFAFMLDMKKALDLRGELTLGQAKGVLNCMAAQGRWELRQVSRSQGGQKASPKVDLQGATPIPNGTYTVVLNDQDYVTLRLKDDFRYDGPEGGQVIQMLTGPDNESQYTGLGFVDGVKISFWRKNQYLLDQDHRISVAIRVLFEAQDKIKYGEAYALESGRCFRCGRKLTVPTSLHRGLGPDCAAALGVA